MAVEEDLKKEIRDLRTEVRDLKEFVKALYSMIMEEDDEYVASDTGGGIEVGRFNT